MESLCIWCFGRGFSRRNDPKLRGHPLPEVRHASYAYGRLHRWVPGGLGLEGATEMIMAITLGDWRALCEMRNLDARGVLLLGWARMPSAVSGVRRVPHVLGSFI